MMSMCHSISRITACFCRCGLQEHAAQCVVFDFPSSLPAWRRNKSLHSIEVCVACSVFSVLSSDLWCFVYVCVFCVFPFAVSLAWSVLSVVSCVLCMASCLLHGRYFLCVLIYLHVNVICMYIFI